MASSILSAVGNTLGNAVDPLATQAIKSVSSMLNPASQPNTPATPPAAGISTLPKPAVTPTAPTGVASSSLADQNLSTQSQGAQSIQSAVDTHTANKAAIPTFDPTSSVTDLLSSKGMASDFSSRSQLAQKAGIKDYVGTPAQNQQLMGYINNPPQSSTTSSGGSSTTSTSGSQNGAPTDNSTPTAPTTDASGNPIQPTTGSAGDVYSPAITKNQQDIANAYQGFQDQVKQILTGTFPLSGLQQTILDNTSTQFANIAQAQMIANKSYEGAVALAGNRLGINIQSPMEYAAEQVNAVNQGLQKIQNLDTQAATTLATLTQGFLDKDYTMINDSYNDLAKALEAKGTALSDLQKRTDSLFTSTRDYNEKVDEFAKSQAQQKQEFEQTQALERAKLNAQYAGLIDPATGAFKETANPATLPGVSTLPVELGNGAAAHYVDLGQIADKGLATYIAQAAKASGYGVVDSSQNKTFNQSLAAISGLTGAIQSGALNGNDKISNTIGQKHPPSIVTRIFQGTQPDAISSVLGAGGAAIPNVQDMTWGQAAQYLQSSIYAQMGTNTTAQKYAMNPAMATSDLQTYSQASPTNFDNVSKLLTANPQLTDSQVMQILNPQ